MDTEELILKKGLSWIEQYGWNTFNPAFLADDHYSIADIFKYFESKSAFLQRFIGFIDKRTLETLDENKNDCFEAISEKEYIWDMLMIRFETMNQYKAAIKRIWQDSLLSADVKSICDHFWASSDKKMIEIAQQKCKQHSLLKGWLANPAIFYGLRFYVFLTWIKEDDPDLPYTMAVLDRAIDKITSF